MTAATKGMKARTRVAATGTPVENGLSELWCIVDFAQPGKLGSQREFRQAFEQPLISSTDPAETARLVGELQDRLVPHYVRRLKRDVLEGLPERQDVRYDVGLGPRQRQIYARLAEAVRDGSMIPLEGIQKLITVCSHPELTEPAGAHIEDLIGECPKLQQTLRLLAPVQKAGERAVVFTRLRSMQRILQDALRHTYGVHAPIINGEVAGARRVEMVEQFNEADSFGVLILGPEAGGVGLNITGPNHVVHYTRLWNPAKENQATDRVHRLGQTRPVTVHYPIVTGTVEEKLHQLLEEKRSLAENVLVPRESLSVMDELIESLGAPVA
jgi:SNF2 family DNA or RNA helicase